MRLFSKEVSTIDDVRTRLDIMPKRMNHDVRSRNPYLQLLTSREDTFFIPRRTLVQGERRVKGSYAGAVIIKKLPTLETPTKLPVAIPTGGTHDQRSYLAAIVNSSEIDAEIIEAGDRTAIAHEAATLAVYGLLAGERPGLRLSVPERKTDVLTALWQNRR
ncbi:hypothetical protein BH09PAT4_BH09PAT4_07530 [soil metagenome]